MSKHRDITLTVALGVSLAAHMFLVRAMVDADARVRIGFPGFPGVARSGDQPEDDKSPIVAMPVIVPNEALLGQRDGTGNSTDAMPGDEEMQSRLVSEAQVQPLTRREQPGVEQSGASASPQLPSPSAPASAPPSVPVPTPLAESDSSDDAPIAPFGAAANLTDGSDAPFSRPVLRPSVASEPAKPAAPTTAAPTPTSPVSMTTGLPAPRGAAAPQGESESDPFALIGSAEFRGGRTNVQLGRPHRITKPRFDLRSLVDTIPLGGVHMALSLRIDQTGNVISADVSESSGSRSIDQLFRVAAYDWWFEPKTDASGVPRASETFRFGIVMH